LTELTTTLRVSMHAWLAGGLMLLAGCAGGGGRSVLFSDMSVAQVQAAYIDVLTREVHPSQIDADFDPDETEARLSRYGKALKEAAADSPGETDPEGETADRGSGEGGVGPIDDCLAGRFWSGGVCRAEWSQLLGTPGVLGGSCREKAAVAVQDDGRVKLTVWHWRRNTFLSSMMDRKPLACLWEASPLIEKQRIAAVVKRAASAKR